MEDRRQLRFWLVSLLALSLLLWLFSPILSPFVAGWILAYLLHPLTNRLERLVGWRWLATTIALGGFLLIVIGALVVLIPVVVRQAVGFVQALPDYLMSVQAAIGRATERFSSFFAPGAMPEGGTGLPSDAVSWVGTVLGHIWRGGLALVDLVTFVTITPIVAFYLLRDWKQMHARIAGLLPRNHRETIVDLANEADRTLAGFIRGQLTVCLVLGSFYAVALTAAGLNFGLFVGMGAGLLSFIPYVGSATGFIVSTGIAFAQFDEWHRWVIIMAIFLGGQFLEGNFLTPKVVGDQVGLHAVWVIFALLAGGSLLGLTGVMLAVPVAAVIGVLVRFAIRQYMASRYYTGHDRVILVPNEEGRPPVVVPPPGQTP